MDELNVLNAPKKVVDGLVEVFDGLAQMFAGVSEQLDMLAADAKTEDEPELPVAEQPVLPVTEKKGPAVSHPRKKPVKKTKKVEEAAPSAIEEAAEVPVVEDFGEAEEAVNSESSETAESEHPVDDADALPWEEDTGQKEALSDKATDKPVAKAETQSAVTITKDEITAVIVAKIKKKRDNNDIAPFKNILNEMYSKDISKKVHSSYLLKAQKGQFTGCLAPFGYRKDPEDKNHLLIDEETAPIVRLIFGYALNGHGPNYIRRRLEEEKIPCPTWWNRERGLRNTRTKWEKKDPENGRYMWDFSVIKDLLMNPVYTGAIASQKKDYRFKIGTIGEKKPEDWIVVEGQHEPLIDRMSFDIVQNKLKSRQRPGQTNEISLFAGLIKCGECGKSLTVRYTNAKHPQRIYSCKTYNAFGKNHCTQHRIDYDTLYSHVLRKIRECARAALMDGEAVADRLTNTCEAEQREQREAMERSLTRDEERIEVLDKMVMRLYEDMIAGRISEQNFNTMLEKTQTEQTELKTKVSEGRKRLSDEVQLANDAKQWVEAIQEYANITELDAATLNRLIKEIVVHERIDEDKTRHISIEIHFNLKPIPEVEQVTA